MTAELWQVLLGGGMLLTVVAAILVKVGTNFFSELRADIKATQALDTKVSSHESQIIEILRRLASLEGGIKADMQSLDRRLTDVNNSVIRLETGLKFTDQIRGLLGRRHTDPAE